MVSEEAVSKPVHRPLERRDRIGLCILLVCVVAFVCYWRQDHARYTVVGKIDPVTGYRCVYTVSQNWKKTESREGMISVTPSLGLMDSCLFTPSHSPGVQAWIDAHVLRRPISGLAAGHNKIGIDAMRADARQIDRMNLVEDNQGFLAIKFVPAPIRIIQHKRLRINGHPAYWVVTKSQFMEGFPPPPHLYECELWVKPLHQPVLFKLEGVTEDKTQFNDILQEWTAVLDSLRVERLPVR